MSKQTTGSRQIAAEIINRPVEEWLPEQYLTYALYVIRDRALVSTDGLKPVVRRIVWSMFKNGNTPNTKHLKAARVAANTVAYHPHGDASVQDALARAAQKFVMRVPLIDAYGTVGSVTGDIPAAARYWEARLTSEALELVKEVPHGAVPLSKNYDGELDEPNLLPVRWPVDIINGTQGIAVGYASKTYAHNPTEVMNAARKILKNPNMTVKTLLKTMPGPDFPTGGELFGVDGVEEYYKTGSGTFTVRARYSTEQLTRGRTKIIFYELPYEISAENIVERIRFIKGEGHFKGIAREDDFTDKKNGLRLVIETKAGANHLSVLNELFKRTNLENKYSVNNTVLIDGSPVRIPMLDLLNNFIEFRKQCTLNKAHVRIQKIDDRIHQLESILAVLVDIDKAISIIRKSNTVDDARKKLMTSFKLDEDQADYILAMQLRRLTKADSIEVQKEKDNLEDEKQNLHEILQDEETLVKAVDQDLLQTKKIIDDERRTVISGVTTEELKEQQKNAIQEANQVEKNVPCYVTKFTNGSVIKTNEPYSYSSRMKKFPTLGIDDQIKMQTHDHLVLVSSNGLGHKIPLSHLPENKEMNMKKLGMDFDKGVHLVGIAKYEPHETDVGFAMGTKKGFVKISKTDFPNKDEFPVFNLDDDDEIINVRWINKTCKGKIFTFVSSDGSTLVFDAESIRVSGSKSSGVRGIKIKQNAEALYFGLITDLKNEYFLTNTSGSVKKTQVAEVPQKNKGGQGVAIHLFRKGESQLQGAVNTSEGAVLSKGDNMSLPEPPFAKRSAGGMKVDFPVSVHSKTAFEK